MFAREVQPFVTLILGMIANEDVHCYFGTTFNRGEVAFHKNEGEGMKITH